MVQTPPPKMTFFVGRSGSLDVVNSGYVSGRKHTLSRYRQRWYRLNCKSWRLSRDIHPNVFSPLERAACRSCNYRFSLGNSNTYLLLLFVYLASRFFSYSPLSMRFISWRFLYFFPIKSFSQRNDSLFYRPKFFSIISLVFYFISWHTSGTVVALLPQILFQISFEHKILWKKFFEQNIIILGSVLIQKYILKSDQIWK